mmetsp:Transcript_12004/g.26197  ORF Transcript_12004/g.26197 Transcript_12004/m.26197 type:complete len:221 (+) Transcript_12004:2162-2824(+)
MICTTQTAPTRRSCGTLARFRKTWRTCFSRQRAWTKSGTCSCFTFGDSTSMKTQSIKGCASSGRILSRSRRMSLIGGTSSSSQSPLLNKMCNALTHHHVEVGSAEDDNDENAFAFLERISARHWPTSSTAFEIALASAALSSSASFFNCPDNNIHSLFEARSFTNNCSNSSCASSPTRAPPLPLPTPPTFSLFAEICDLIRRYSTFFSTYRFLSSLTTLS